MHADTAEADHLWQIDIKRQVSGKNAPRRDHEVERFVM